jgi:hypothetical protein
MFKNTFFAKEPLFLKVIYILAFLGIIYNMYLMIFTTNDINPLILRLTSGTVSVLIFRKMLKDQKEN